MTEPIITLGPREVALLLVLVAAIAGLSLWRRLQLEVELMIATLRSVVQLVTVGLVIGWVFEQRSWPWVLGLLAVMTPVAGFTGGRRAAVRLRHLAGILSLVLGATTALTLVYVSVVVIRLDAWDARYLIPLGGMLLGNAMTAGTLAVERLVADLRGRSADVETLLTLGASPVQATNDMTRAAIRAAMTPTLNTMMIVGIVQLPGMMTGQMLGGTAPLQAALYQLLILVAIAFSTALTAIVVLAIVTRRFFTAAWQLDRSALAPV